MTSTRLWRPAVLVKTRVWLGCSVCGLIKPGVGYSYWRIFLGTLRSVIIGLFSLVPRNNPRRLCQFPSWRMANGVKLQFQNFLKIVNKSQWNLNATHKVSGNQIKFSLHRLFSNWLQGNGFSFFLASSFDQNAPRTNTVFCSTVIQIFSLGHLWSDA